MKRNPISFRELIERVLPLDLLPALERERLREALALGEAARVERAALVAVERLVALGHLERMPDRLESGERVVRFQRTDGQSVIALRFPSPPLPHGLIALPRALATLSAAAPLERLRRLIRLDDPLAQDESRLPSGPTTHRLPICAATSGSRRWCR